MFRDYPQMIEDRPHPFDESLRRLWAAVINQAEDDVRGVPYYQDKNSRFYKILMKEQAEAWFRNDRVFTGSFVWICDTLKLDPARIRARVLNGGTDKPSLSVVGGHHESTFQGKISAQALGRKQRQVCRV